MGLAAPRHVGSSRSRAQTRVPCIGRQILNHCATREVPYVSVLNLCLISLTPTSLSYLLPPCLISYLDPSSISLNLTLDIIPQALDLTSLVGLAFPLVGLNTHLNIYSNTEESAASLAGVPSKRLASINTKSKGSELGLKELYKARVSKLG